MCYPWPNTKTQVTTLQGFLNYTLGRFDIAIIGGYIFIEPELVAGVARSVLPAAGMVAVPLA